MVEGHDQLAAITVLYWSRILATTPLQSPLVILWRIEGQLGTQSSSWVPIFCLLLMIANAPSNLTMGFQWSGQPCQAAAKPLAHAVTTEIPASTANRPF